MEFVKRFPFSLVPRSLRGTGWIRSWSGNKPLSKHHEITKSPAWDMKEVDATVVKIQDISPTVKKISLQVAKPLQFKAGQWVDLTIPEVDVVGGFSICSCPILLEEKNILELAVKSSHHPPAHWIHSKCQVGKLVRVRVGGDFFLDPNKDEKLLLIAGGVGVNPIYSILLHKHFLLKHKLHKEPALLLYSSRSTQELLFKDELSRLDKDKIFIEYFVTREAGPPPSTNVGRIDKAKLSLLLSKHQMESSKVRCYLCGPAGMIRQLEKNLLSLSIPQELVNYEKWW